MSQRLDRRRFLRGLGGAALALPMLEAFAPRKGFAGVEAPPKRVVFVMHRHGRPLSRESGPDPWTPGAAGALSATISPALAELGPIRDKIVTIDGIDNVVRHTTGDDGGHGSVETSCLTCAVPNWNGVADNETASAASIDYVLGERLRANTSMRPSIVFPAQCAGGFYWGGSCYGPDGSPPWLASTRPEEVVSDLFGSVQTDPDPPAPTLHDRLVTQRKSILDGVAKDFLSLRSKLNAADRDRLDQHAAFIEKLKSAGGGGVTPTESCTVPDVGAFPDYSGENGRGQKDAITTPLQIENVVQALACDITRVAVLDFYAGYDPLFPSEFPSGNDMLLNSNWHALIHENWNPSDPAGPVLMTAFNYFTKSFRTLVERLNQMVDLDGNPMLDSTLVVWVSEMGFGSGHLSYDVPVIMAGMPSAFPGGQGRHVVAPRHTMGDLWAQVLRMTGGTDETFGITGTLGDHKSGYLVEWSGMDIGPSTPLHRGPLPL